VVRNNTEAERFEIAVAGSTAILQYGIRGDRIFIYHTEVPPVFRGRGYGELLARAALDFARERSLEVQPLCPFVRAFLEKHPEYR
jgi:predicted GNAT family acetyltransferase